MHPYEWAIVRAVPRVERCEFVNVGAVVYCQALDFLSAAFEVSRDRLLALDPAADVDAIERHLHAVAAVCAGAPEAGANGARSQGDRFRWLTAPRSTIVQMSPIHTGLTADPARELQRLMESMVRVGGG